MTERRRTHLHGEVVPLVLVAVREDRQGSNVGVWVAVDAEELHDVLSDLPLWPWADIEVTPLITHVLVTDAK
ncbi:muconolactone Delta-isomerase family protein [Saccharopolyspora gloriosae]|uniref:muconolactone Delta-isomerase family protein n=1 Tax=Saccharopolyspora gloriosae TaxID=455344 RepID=UPI001FB69D48|nr:muconolactone Delta-isomerase family protein [Saccharopolyspora gloriosae]